MKGRGRTAINPETAETILSVISVRPALTVVAF